MTHRGNNVTWPKRLQLRNNQFCTLLYSINKDAFNQCIKCIICLIKNVTISINVLHRSEISGASKLVTSSQVGDLQLGISLGLLLSPLFFLYRCALDDAAHGYDSSDKWRWLLVEHPVNYDILVSRPRVVLKIETVELMVQFEFKMAFGWKYK